MSVGLMVCYARSGGTILNRCLGCLPGVVMLSEVTPLVDQSPAGGEPRTVKDQARQWYGIELQSHGFTESAGGDELVESVDLASTRLGR